MNLMYEENRKSQNWFVGCLHNCIYCLPSFQQQMKRQKHNCLKCYRYEPHAHLERLNHSPPKTDGKQFIFFPSSGDVAFASPNELNTALDYVEEHPDVNFLMQSKAPDCFLIKRKIPDNLILATTIETNRVLFFTPSHYKNYEQISDAPLPLERTECMMRLQTKRRIITIEPILTFHHPTMVHWMVHIKPEAIYIGYDNHNCKLPEPPLKKTQQLIYDLRHIAPVRVKTLRKAWWEK